MKKQHLLKSTALALLAAASLTAYQEAWGSVCDNIYAE